jgi:hypothetical protein
MSLRAPPDELLERFNWVYREFLIRVLWALQRHPKTIATSWYRTRAENALVGGHPNSQHLLGFAVDVVVPVGDETAAAAELRHAGVVPVVEWDHVHIQAFPAHTLPPSLFEQFSA